jgi:hypothetical protein
MRRLSRRKGLTLAAAVSTALAASGLGAYAAASGGSGRQPKLVEELGPETTGPGRFAKAYDLNANAATPVFALRNGQTVSVVGNATAECLLSSGDGRASGETCDTQAAVDQGQAISVTDECGASSGKLMEITGLAPAGVSSVQLESSDGAYQTATVVRGAFKFEGTNPAPGAPYPTGVHWVASDGADLGAAALPVSGDQFCIPTP